VGDSLVPPPRSRPAAGALPEPSATGLTPRRPLGQLAVPRSKVGPWAELVCCRYASSRRRAAVTLRRDHNGRSGNMIAAGGLVAASLSPGTPALSGKSTGLVRLRRPKRCGGGLDAGQSAVYALLGPAFKTAQSALSINAPQPSALGSNRSSGGLNTCLSSPTSRSCRFSRPRLPTGWLGCGLYGGHQCEECLQQGATPQG
jgi:hypothetical protein